MFSNKIMNTMEQERKIAHHSHKAIYCPESTHIQSSWKTFKKLEIKDIKYIQRKLTYLSCKPLKVR